MKKITVFLFLIFIFLSFSSDAFSFKRKEKASLYLTATDPRVQTYTSDRNEPINVFRKGDRIYFSVLNPKGFKSKYIKYQIIKQDDNAHIGGYSRVMNKTVMIQNKNYYIDYFTINSKGKYFIQIFDIENLHQWIVMGAFAVLDE